MSLETRIMQDLKEAMKNKDDAGKRSIRSIKAAILLQKTDGSGKELDEAGEIKILQKLVKQRKDSLEIYEKQGREDLAQPEREEKYGFRQAVTLFGREAWLTEVVDIVSADGQL